MRHVTPCHLALHLYSTLQSNSQGHSYAPFEGTSTSYGGSINGAGGAYPASSQGGWPASGPPIAGPDSYPSNTPQQQQQSQWSAPTIQVGSSVSVGDNGPPSSNSWALPQQQQQSTTSQWGAPPLGGGAAVVAAAAAGPGPSPSYGVHSGHSTPTYFNGSLARPGPAPAAAAASSSSTPYAADPQFDPRTGYGPGQPPPTLMHQPPRPPQLFPSSSSASFASTHSTLSTPVNGAYQSQATYAPSPAASTAGISVIPTPHYAQPPQQQQQQYGQPQPQYPAPPTSTSSSSSGGGGAVPFFSPGAAAASVSARKAASLTSRGPSGSSGGSGTPIALGSSGGSSSESLSMSTGTTGKGKFVPVEDGFVTTAGNKSLGAKYGNATGLLGVPTVQELWQGVGGGTSSSSSYNVGVGASSPSPGGSFIGEQQQQAYGTSAAPPPHNIGVVPAHYPSPAASSSFNLGGGSGAGTPGGGAWPPPPVFAANHFQQQQGYPPAEQQQQQQFVAPTVDAGISGGTPGGHGRFGTGGPLPLQHAPPQQQQQPLQSRYPPQRPPMGAVAYGQQSGGFT